MVGKLYSTRNHISTRGWSVGHRARLGCPRAKALPVSVYGKMPSQICCIKKLHGGSFPVELMDFRGSCGQGDATPVKHKVKFLFK